MATRKLPPRLGVSAAAPPSAPLDRPRPTAPTMTSRRLMPRRGSTRSLGVIRLSIEEPRAVLAKLDERGPVGDECLPRGSDQMFRARGADGVATDTLGH